MAMRRPVRDPHPALATRDAAEDRAAATGICRARYKAYNVYPISYMFIVRTRCVTRLAGEHASMHEFTSGEVGCHGESTVLD
jgi:hypothetical protein